MPWIYKNAPFDDLKEETHKEVYGFVYLITNLANNKKYIGKKFFWKKGHKMVKGKKKSLLTESDWKKYFGSNKVLIEDVKALGEDKFAKEILYMCKSKSECSYLEAYEQFKNNVLLRDDYYNEWISFKIAQKHLQSLKNRIEIIPCY